MLHVLEELIGAPVTQLFQGDCDFGLLDATILLGSGERR